MQKSIYFLMLEGCISLLNFHLAEILDGSSYIFSFHKSISIVVQNISLFLSLLSKTQNFTKLLALFSFTVLLGSLMIWCGFWASLHITFLSVHLKKRTYKCNNLVFFQFVYQIKYTDWDWLLLPVEYINLVANLDLLLRSMKQPEDGCDVRLPWTLGTWRS